MESMPIRPAFWNIPFWAEIGVYVVGLIAAVVCVVGICRCVHLWRQGQDRHGSPLCRLFRQEAPHCQNQALLLLDKLLRSPA